MISIHPRFQNLFLYQLLINLPLLQLDILRASQIATAIKKFTAGPFLHKVNQRKIFFTTGPALKLSTGLKLVRNLNVISDWKDFLSILQWMY